MSPNLRRGIKTLYGKRNVCGSLPFFLRQPLPKKPLFKKPPKEYFWPLNKGHPKPNVPKGVPINQGVF